MLKKTLFQEEHYLPNFFRPLLTHSMFNWWSYHGVHYSDVLMSADQRKYQNSASLAFVRGIHQWPVNSPHKGPVTRKMFPFDDVIICDVFCEINVSLAVCSIVSHWEYILSYLKLLAGKIGFVPFGFDSISNYPLGYCVKWTGPVIGLCSLQSSRCPCHVTEPVGETVSRAAHPETDILILTLPCLNKMDAICRRHVSMDFIQWK